MNRWTSLRRYCLNHIFLIAGLVLLLLPGIASGQGFMVTPMRVDFSPHAGEVIDTQLSVRNTTGESADIIVNASLLGQTQFGASKPIDAKSDYTGPARTRSCYDWMTLSTNTLSIPALDSRSVKLRIKVPHGVRGFYGAVLLVQTKPANPSPNTMGLQLQFLVPVMLHVQGYSARERIALLDAGMAFREATGEYPATSFSYFYVRNDGETFCWLEGRVAVLYPIGKSWQQVTEITLPQYPILPGNTLTIYQDLQRRLPAGKYKVVVDLKVGTRSVGHLEKEVNFAGDPAITNISSDIPLITQPPDITMKAVPGSRRTFVLTIQNPTEETVQLECAVNTPKELLGITMGNIKGADFDCASWIEISPAKFTLKGGGKQSIRLSIMYPAEGSNQPNHYADLFINSRRLDGQSAGNMKLPVWIENSQLTSKVKGEGLLVNLAQQENNLYSVTAKFANTGDRHLTPTVIAQVVSSMGSTFYTKQLDTSAGRILPLMTPSYSGTLDFTNVPIGTHLILVSMKYSEENVILRLPVRVEEKDNQKIITVITPPVKDTAPPAGEVKHNE